MIWPKGQDKNFIKLVWAVLSIGVALVSYFFFGPLNPKFFNSDQAIHVLMTCDFNWTEDAYYWGQNRLGSFLPLLASPIYQATNIHPIFLLGFLNFLFLLIAYYFLQKHIESNYGKLFFLLALFFPHPTYYYLLLIGHPYGAQILCLTLSVHTYILFKRKLENDYSKISGLVYLYLFLFFVFSTLSVWINELSLLLFLGIFLSLLRSKLNGKYFFAEVLKNWRHYKYLWFTSIFLVYLGYSFIHYLKVNAFQDAEYSKTFIFSKEDILKQLD
ncbi:MAG: hypothetical protein K9J84_14705, partial [Bacteroidia bacterium]|nr:hypothetical protein [Bacteroidia bacterium]